MCRGIGQWIDNLHLLDDRSGPSVRDDERQRILMLRTHVNEMNVQAIDRRDEVREGLESRLALAPIVFLRPVARERLNRRELYALRLICDGLLVGPARGRDARAQILQFRFGGLDLERSDRYGSRWLCSRDRHGGPFSRGLMTAPLPPSARRASRRS